MTGSRRTRSFSDATPPPLSARTTTEPLLWRSRASGRLPDRGSLRPDVFGRRRGDGTSTGADEFMSMSRLPSRRTAAQSLPAGAFPVPDDDDDGGGPDEESANAIERALADSFGRLRGSKNMTAAFAKVARSRDGTVRRSDVAALAHAALQPPPGADPKELLVVEKGSSRKKTRVEPPTFSTTMTARQAAATLETICRDMRCKVKRVDEAAAPTPGSPGAIVRLRVARSGARFGPPALRRVRAVIVIAEHDKLRTDVYLRRATGLLPDHAAFATLSDDIRARFQREWPRIVDALYVRVPR